jgi:hypothetical protein
LIIREAVKEASELWGGSVTATMAEKCLKKYRAYVKELKSSAV